MIGIDFISIQHKPLMFILNYLALVTRYICTGWFIRTNPKQINNTVLNYAQIMHMSWALCHHVLQAWSLIFENISPASQQHTVNAGIRLNLILPSPLHLVNAVIRLNLILPSPLHTVNAVIRLNLILPSPLHTVNAVIRLNLIPPSPLHTVNAVISLNPIPPSPLHCYCNDLTKPHPCLSTVLLMCSLQT